MKKYPKAVFVIENGKYIELTYKEFCIRKEKELCYTEKYYVSLQGFLMEVDYDNYKYFYRTYERQKYIKKLNKKYGLLYCRECGTPYRRCTWSRDGKKKIVWRCVSRLDYGKKYCKNSPSVEESRLHNAIAAAITKKANSEEINIGGIMNHIESFGSRRDTDGIIPRQRRVSEIEKVIDDLARLNSDEAQSGELDYKFSELYAELYSVKDELEEMQNGASALDGDMLNEMREVVTGLKNHPVEYDDKVVRQLIDCIKVMSADTIKICFKDGTVTETAL